MAFSTEPLITYDQFLDCKKLTYYQRRFYSAKKRRRAIMKGRDFIPLSELLESIRPSCAVSICCYFLKGTDLIGKCIDAAMSECGVDHREYYRFFPELLFLDLQELAAKKAEWKEVIRQRDIFIKMLRASLGD